MKKFFRKLTRTQWLILFYLPFGIISSYFCGIAGFIGSIIGWLIGLKIGATLDKNSKAIRNYNYGKFFRNRKVEIITLLLLIPVDALAYHFGGWKTFAAVTIGWLFGIFTWRSQKKRR